MALLWHSENNNNMGILNNFLGTILAQRQKECCFV